MIHTLLLAITEVQKNYREPIRKYFKSKKLSFSVNKSPTFKTGKPTMRHDINQKYFVDLNKAELVCV